MPPLRHRKSQDVPRSCHNSVSTTRQRGLVAEGTRHAAKADKLSKEHSCFVFTFNVLPKACLVLSFGIVRSIMGLYCLKAALLKRNSVGHNSP